MICGTAASSESARRGQYYAGPGNRFWSVLHDVGLTDRLLHPSEFRTLLDYGIGLTDVVKGQAGGDQEIDFGDSGALLEGRLASYAPRCVCVNGKRAAREAVGRVGVEYGLQEKRFGPTRLFVAPSTSAAARRWWDGSVWRDLVSTVRSRRSVG